MLDKVQTAAKLDVKISTLDGALKNKIPRYKIGGSIRFKEEEVDAYIDSCRIEVRQPLEIGRFKYVPGMKVCVPRTSSERASQS